jgi:protein gp37
MGEITEISWASGTFNPWWGCARVSKACRKCYAEAFAHRLGMDIWGQSNGRRFFDDKHWNQPRLWNRKAEKEGRRRQIFCASMADVFEDHDGLPEQRERLWALIADTPWLDWLLLTKRPQNIASMVPWVVAPDNVWLGTTTEDQECADERIPHLLSNPAVVHFLSCEPLLSSLNLAGWLGSDKVNWVLCGGESGSDPHPMHPDWARSLRDQCIAAGTPFHFKQWGEYRTFLTSADPEHDPTAWLSHDGRLRSEDEAVSEPATDWIGVHRIGKKRAGRLLDGREWNEIPEPSHG